ncbi:MAG: tRNA lysidine(34) synthetase TilS [Thermovirgaceae bacterium]|nr:tRNA lysidine(34) synthetase TilS [Synergistales bacterium]HPC76640.1 tRNA lysidine(34) synthetase TilS [Synergistales bacterium]HRS49036.1 tRNA lysidine(34) synthetase TilS [Thermovirgaceae bacterium]HRU91370.1 tRNA lysidine(34) synthetase TilS [Thermovirgaceae bacterium]
MTKDHPSVGRWSPGTRSLFRRFETAGRDQGWWDHDGPIVAAVSGGSDSMALFWLLRFRWKGRVIAAHLEHGFRQETSLRDAAFVERISREWNTECHVERLDIPSMKRRGETLEEAGRRERYAFLRRVASLTGAPFIATGHTSDDLVETVFLNLLRGTGVRGLRGIPWARGKVVRPIMGISRDELRGFLLEVSVPWMEDETNLETKYFRNKIRHVFLPLLCNEGNSRFKDHLLDLSLEAGELEAAREKKSRSMAAWCRRWQPFALRSWDLDLLRRMDDQAVQSIIAFEGRDLGLSTLSRGKTSVLLGLIRKGEGRWRFQWEGDLEICASGRTASLVERKIFSAGGPGRETFALHGEKGSIQWGRWRFDWRFNDNLPPALGVGSCRVPADDTGPVEILSACTAEKGDLPEGAFPWWAGKIWPLVKFSGTSWIPFTVPPGSTVVRSDVKPGPSLQIRAKVIDEVRKGETEDGV